MVDYKRNSEIVERAFRLWGALSILNRAILLQCGHLQSYSVHIKDKLSFLVWRDEVIDDFCKDDQQVLAWSLSVEWQGKIRSQINKPKDQELTGREAARDLFFQIMYSWRDEGS